MTPYTQTRFFGHGPRVGLAIHCSLAHAGAWHGVGAALADDMTLLAYDLPSHGRSGDWDGGADLHDVATDMGRTLVTEQVDLIGHSFGATVALRLAVEMPERVRSLTLIEPVYFAVAFADEPVRRAAYDAATAPFEAALKAGDRMEAARAFNRAWGDGTRWDDIPARRQQYMADRIHFVTASAPFLRDDCAGLLVEGLLARADMPTLLLEGGNSDDLARAINSGLEKRLPNARSVVIAGAGHMAPLTHPLQVADAIRDLIAAA